ncbi:MAG: hypothetical protein ACKOQ6_05145 [Bacteroidota bacterium]
MKKLIMPLLFIGIFLVSCYYDNVEELNAADMLQPCNTPDTPGYANDIQPILNSRCGSGEVACHNADNSLSLGGNSGSLADYAGTIETISDRGPVDFMLRINHDPAIASTKWMPKGSSSKIEACSIEKIQLWVDQGQLNN